MKVFLLMTVFLFMIIFIFACFARRHLQTKHDLKGIKFYYDFVREVKCNICGKILRDYGEWHHHYEEFHERWDYDRLPYDFTHTDTTRVSESE